MNQPENRRKFARLDLALTVSYKVSDQINTSSDSIETSSSDISIGGLRLMTPTPLKNSTLLDLNIILPDDEENPIEHLNFQNIKEWTNWLFNKELPNKIIGDSEHLNKLNNVLKFEQALNAFRQGIQIDKALELTDNYNERIESSIKQAISYLEDADSVSHKVTFFYSNVLDDLKDINKLLQKIKLAKDNFESQTFENGI